METNQLTTTGILGLFETSKQQRKEFVDDVVLRMQNGDIDPLKVHLQVKAMEEIITQLTSTDEKKNKNITAAISYKNMLLEAAQKYGKDFELHNAKFSIKEVGTSYDWSKCDDPKLAALLAQQETLKEEVKKRQDFLKTVPSSGLALVIDDEMVTVYPPAKSSTTSVAVSLK